MRWIARFAIFVLLLSSCTQVKTDKDKDTEQTPIRTFSSEALGVGKEAPKCKSLIDSYCNYLYSPESQGNLSIKRGRSPIEVLQGDTRNEFTQVYYRYALAKLRNQSKLPVDFKAALKRLKYFEKLSFFINRPERSRMQLQDRIANESSSYELDYIWSAALNETLLKRINKKFPGYHKLSDRSVPIEIQLERRRLNRILISEISRSIWSDDVNWQRVEQNFDRLKIAYGKMIAKLDIPHEIAQKWTDRIDKIVLALPGSMPAISDDECSSTTANAYYYTFLNVITVCAGDFNSEDIIQTLAHEMGHSLGVDRDAYLFEINSEFGKKLADMREQVCKPEAFSCADWEKYKSDFQSELGSLDSFKADLPQFQQCLKRRPTAKSLTDDDVARFANSIVTDHFSELASSDRFLRITKAEIPMRDGKLQKNPNYLNPCSYYLWSLGEEPIHDELTSLMYFTAEYRCSDQPGPARMKNAIEQAKNMTARLMEKVLKIEGEFSARDRLETEGFSSPPHERFADVLGSYAMAELLREIPGKWDRRNLFLASSSWQCSEPSLASRFPDESSIENQYVFESHSAGDQRKKEFFTTPMREALGCEKDFDFNECSLPFKK